MALQAGKHWEHTVEQHGEQASIGSNVTEASIRPKGEASLVLCFHSIETYGRNKSNNGWTEEV